MRLLRILVIAVAAIVVAGAVASASPPTRAAFETEPTPQVSATHETPAPAESPESEPTEPSSPAPLAGEASPPGSDEGGADEDSPSAPDFSACVGMRGLENAICRHEALLEASPGNLGFQNVLAHLEANVARHEGGSGPAAEGERGPGKSCESHGNGDEHSHGKP